MFIIAEIGQAHEGSLGMAHSFIDALSETSVNGIKWQIHIAEAESSIQEPFRIKFSYEDKTRFDYWKRMSFNIEQWKDLKHHCNEKGMEFLASPFSNLAVDWLEEIGVSRYKLGSGEINNMLILEKIAQTNKPIILSSGMSSYLELDKSINFLKEKNIETSILQCTTSYPTEPKNWGLNVIQEMKNMYKVPVGFSDHSGNIFACLAATSLGAEILEFHATFDKRMFGPDSKSSLNMEEIKVLVKGVKDIKTALNYPVDKNDIDKYSDLKSIFEKSLAINKDLSKGHIVSFEDLESKKPKGMGISAAEFKHVIGRSLNKDVRAWSFINSTDLE